MTTPITHTIVRTENHDEVAVKSDDWGISVLLGPDGISASVRFDAGEAREIGEALIEAAQTFLPGACEHNPNAVGTCQYCS